MASQNALAAAASLALWPAQAFPQDNGGWVGKRVITKPNTVVRVAKQVVDDEDRGKNLARGKDQSLNRVYRVEKESGTWLWLVAEKAGARGWVQNSQVVPYDQAIEYISAEIRANPGVSAIYLWRGNVWESKGQLDKAIADFDQAIKLDPNNPSPYNNRGIVWRKEHDHDKAIAQRAAASPRQCRQCRPSGRDSVHAVSPAAQARRATLNRRCTAR